MKIRDYELKKLRIGNPQRGGGFGTGYSVEPAHGSYKTLKQAREVAKNLAHQHKLYGDPEEVTVVSNHSGKVVARYKPNPRKKTRKTANRRCH